MTDRPIIFSGPMVRALLEGRKTQDRRVLKSRPRRTIFFDAKTAEMDQFREPSYAHGDRLWVQEAWSINACGGFSEAGVGEWLYSLDYRAGGSQELSYSGHYSEDPYCDLYDTQIGDWRPSIHMPRWASRLTLTVTDVRVQRLQDISTRDCIAEGIAADLRDAVGLSDLALRHAVHDTYVAGYRALWNTLHGPDAWDANPWVVALTFTVQHGNIDEVTK